jgi:V/A-type H+/Na+-transporting ATPase subunit E
MGSELTDLLEKEAQAEKDKVLADARARAEEILASARRDAEGLQAAARRRAEEDRIQARVQATSTASLRAAALVLTAKDEAIRGVFEQAEAALHQAAGDPARRRAMLQTLLQEAVRGLGGGRAVAEVAPGDVAAVREVCRELGLDVDVRANPQVTDGVRVLSPDGRSVVENTLPSRLARARREMVSQVAEILWGR